MANSHHTDFGETLSASSPTTGGTRTLANSPVSPGDNHNDDDNHQADSYQEAFIPGHMAADSGDRYSFPTGVPSTSMGLDQISAIWDNSSDFLAYYDLSRAENFGDSFFNICQDPVSGLPGLHPAINSLPFSERHIGSARANVPSSLASFYAFTNCDMKNYSGRAPLSRENQVVSVNPSSRSGHIDFVSQPDFNLMLFDPNSYSNNIDSTIGLDFFGDGMNELNYPGEGADLMADLAFPDPDSPNTLAPVSPPELVPDEHHQRNARSLARAGGTVRRGRGVNRVEKQKTANALTRQIIVFDSIPGRTSKNPRLPFLPAKRKEVAAVRAYGACFKCKMKRKKVCTLVLLEWF